MTGYRAITRARKIVFWISATLFVLSWPLLILYALGIVVSPSVTHPVVETGVVRVDSFPAGARILIDGKDTGKTTPAAIERLKAGDYRIELRKKGYLDWRAVVSVDIQMVRRVTYAVLVPRVAQVHLVPTGDHAEAYISHNAQFLVIPGKEVADLRVFDLKARRFVPHAAALVSYEHDQLLQVTPLPWGGDLMLRVLEGNEEMVLIVHLGVLGIELQHTVKEPFLRSADFAWSPTLSGAVYFLENGNLWRTATWTSPTADLLASSLLSVGIVDNTLYYIDTEGRFGEITAFGHRRVLFTIPKSARDLLSSGTKIEYVGDNWGAVLAPQGGLYLLHGSHFSEYPGVRGVAVDKSRSRFLVWSAWRVGSLRFPSGGNAGPRHAIEWAPTPQTGAKISHVTPAADLSNCLFVSNDTVWIEPVLPGVVGHAQRVLALAPGERFRYSDAAGLILIMDRAIGQMRVIRFITRPLIPRLE